jgi:hypothetical protein
MSIDYERLVDAIARGFTEALRNGGADAITHGECHATGRP